MSWPASLGTVEVMQESTPSFAPKNEDGAWAWVWLPDLGTDSSSRTSYLATTGSLMTAAIIMFQAGVMMRLKGLAVVMGKRKCPCPAAKM